MRSTVSLTIVIGTLLTAIAWHSSAPGRVFGATLPGSQVAPPLTASPPAIGQGRIMTPPTNGLATTGPRAGTVAPMISCGFNSSTHRAECSCHGDAECNEMFTSYCKEGGASSCDTGTGNCTCEMRL